MRISAKLREMYLRIQFSDSSVKTVFIKYPCNSLHCLAWRNYKNSVMQSLTSASLLQDGIVIKYYTDIKCTLDVN